MRFWPPALEMDIRPLGTPNHLSHQEGHTTPCVCGLRLAVSCGDGTQGVAETPGCLWGARRREEEWVGAGRAGGALCCPLPRPSDRASTFLLGGLAGIGSVFSQA